MKSFQAVIIAALAISSAAINEPVASPTAAIERELAEYERQLGTDVSPAPTGVDRPTDGVSLFVCSVVGEQRRRNVVVAGYVWPIGRGAVYFIVDTLIVLT